MGISEFALHNVLRTYTQQDRLGKAQKITALASKPPPVSADQVSLTTAGQKVQWLGQLAAEVVDRRQPGLVGDERANEVRETKQQLVALHKDALGDDRVSPDALEALLRPLYTG